jgi:hypothetical protein
MCFVVFLALLQLFTMVLGVPMEISTLILPLMYSSAAACKVTPLNLSFFFLLMKLTQLFP